MAKDRTQIVVNRGDQTDDDFLELLQALMSSVDLTEVVVIAPVNVFADLLDEADDEELDVDFSDDDDDDEEEDDEVGLDDLDFDELKALCKEHGIKVKKKDDEEDLRNKLVDFFER